MAVAKSKTKKPTSFTPEVDDVEVKQKYTGSKTKSKRELNVVNTKDIFWTPEKKGDFIEGEFVEYEKRVGGKFGTPEKIDGKKVNVSFCGVIAEHETGELIKMPSTKMLNDFFEEMKPGTYVRITFDGKKLKKDKKKGEENSTFNDYILESEGAKENTKKKK